MPFHLAVLAGLASCDDTLFGDYGPPERPDVDPPPPAIRRLTQSQYRHAIRDLFGPEIVLPSGLEPDFEVDGLFAIGASEATLSPRGVEQFETAAYQVASQVLADPLLYDAVVPCVPEAAVDSACARATLDDLGRRVWRRPLTGDELDTLVDLTDAAAMALADFDAGLEFGVAALLQSPHFLYRIEVGEPDEERGGTRYSSDEMATRLAFFLLDTTPDDDLLLAAEDGALVEDDLLAEQVDRLLADPRAREGVRALFSDMLDLAALDELTKDPTVFVHYSETVGASAREETLLGLEYVVFDAAGDGADYRNVFTTRRTFVDRKLASMYSVQAPVREGFGEVLLPDDGRRRGLLGQASVLAAHAHPVSSSATRRGVFLRENLLCQEIPPPPANLNTGIPEASVDDPTLRDRVQVHLTDPFCAECHTITDLVGLGLENFDGLGMWRDRENDVVIDPSGELDGVAFDDAWGLADVMHDHPDVGPCLVDTSYRIATGHRIDSGERELADYLAWRFEEEEFRVRRLLRDIVLSDGFRRVGEVE